MNFINYDKVRETSFKKYITEEIVDILQKDLTSTEIDSYQHEMNNSFIDLSFGETIRQLQEQNYNFLGVGQAPWQHHEWCNAIIFEDKTTFEKYWCHISSYLIEDWRAEIVYMKKGI